jgi:hypothetical protein
LLPGNVRPVALQERRPLEPFAKPLYSWPMKLRPRNDVLFQRPPSPSRHLARPPRLRRGDFLA